MYINGVYVENKGHLSVQCDNPCGTGSIKRPQPYMPMWSPAATIHAFLLVLIQIISLIRYERVFYYKQCIDNVRACFSDSSNMICAKFV